MPRLGRDRSEDRSSMNMRERLEVAATRYILERIDYLAASSPLEQLRSLQRDAEFRQQLHSWLELEVFQNWDQEIETEIRNLSASQIPTPLQLSKEVTHPAPMSTRQIKRSIEARPETNQDVRFLHKKQCAVCLSSWKEILLVGNHLVFTAATAGLAGSPRKVAVFDVQEVFGWRDPTFQKAPFAFE